jgi:VIT1/CCC1 family predicted Fe2+/Mn2+ transporter
VERLTNNFLAFRETHCEEERVWFATKLALSESEKEANALRARAESAASMSTHLRERLDALLGRELTTRQERDAALSECDALRRIVEEAVSTLVEISASCSGSANASLNPHFADRWMSITRKADRLLTKLNAVAKARVKEEKP